MITKAEIIPMAIPSFRIEPSPTAWHVWVGCPLTRTRWSLTKATFRVLARPRFRDGTSDLGSLLLCGGYVNRHCRHGPQSTPIALLPSAWMLLPDWNGWELQAGRRSLIRRPALLH